jgi:hypothetical protein
VQTLSLVSYPWKLNVGVCLGDKKGFWWGDLNERDHLEDLDIDEDSIKMDLQEVGWGCLNWIDLAEDRYMWQALVYAVMNHLVP